VENKPAPRKPSTSELRETKKTSSSRSSVQKPLAREDKRKLRKEARLLHAEDWLAPLGSEQEKQMLKQLLVIWGKCGALSGGDHKVIDEWIRSPEGVKRGRDPLFFATAKEKYLGKVVWTTALQRHKQLDDAEWLVAYFTAQGKSQKRIAALTHLGERRIDDITRNIKKRITEELMCDVESVTLSQMTRWFFGL
jgi:hypothetical protein